MIPTLSASAGPSHDDKRQSSRLVLFVDDQVVARLAGASLRLHEPMPAEIALRYDDPWEGPESGYVSVLRDHEGRFRMYYRGGGERTREVTCVAFSSDGIVWKKPRLGLYEHNGSTANNIVFAVSAPSYMECHNFTPFLDTNPAAPAEARYKAVALGRAYPPVVPDRQKALVVLGSPDGIRWKHLADKAVI